ncbi:MAG: flagellar filament capping protein FliD [Lachnospiraceae bacterium]|nr:flagellar filament capping protein FliD [Lachnospiraceae bacterium]MDE6252031.1 flagellar filament capping protein FliD [Lachnospiraceae bacterium]
MGIGLSGLQSGLDTDTLISELVKAYSIKKDNLVKEQTKLEWKQDAWKTMNSKIYSFYTGLDKMRFSTNYSLKKATSTSSKVKVSADSSAVNGTQTLKVKSTAASGYLTGGKLEKITGADGKQSKITGSTKLKDMGITSGGSISVTVNGTEKNITIGENTTVNNLVVALKEAGVSANFDEDNQRFFISSKKSGAEADFSLTADNANGFDALKKLGLVSYSDKDMQTYRDAANMDVDEKTQATYEKRKTKYTTEAAQKKNLENSVKTLTKTIASQEKDLEYAKIKSDYANEYFGKSWDDIRAKSDELQAKIDGLKAKDSLSDEEKKELSALKTELKAVKEVNGELFNDTLTEEDKERIKGVYADDVDAITKSLTENKDKLENYKDILADESGAKLAAYVVDRNAEIDEKNAKLEQDLKDFYTEQKNQASNIVADYDNNYSVYSSYKDIDSPTAAQTAAYNAAAAALGLDGSTATKIAGQDAEIELNGATFTSSTSNFSINGLTISVNGVTDPEETINITTETDVDAIYDKVKEFFATYNSLINEMDSLYNADSSRGYEPLTDEEKSAMNDSDVEKWEAKIKDSILRRDSTLGSISDLLKTSLMKSYTVNGKKYSLSSFGIKTGGYFATSDNTKGSYHIDGDEDDELTSGNTDKLRKAIASDPETFVSFFTKLTQGVYEELDKKMKSTTLNSAYTVYHDKTMKNEYRDYSKKISEWEDRIAAYEQKYRRQFTAMEKALATLNSNTSFITSMLG